MPNPSKKRPNHKLCTLRQPAEDLLNKQSQEPADIPPTEELQRLLYELQLQQVKLDMQNEELRRAQVDLQAVRDRYADLYDFAPVGYLSLDGNGVIAEANLTTTQLFGVARVHIIGHRLTNWVAPESQDTLYRHRLQVFAEGTTCTSNLWMQRQDGTPFYAQLKSLARRKDGEAPPHWHLALIDLTLLRQRAEEQQAWSAAIVDNSRDAIIGMNVEGTIVSWNAAAERLCDYRASEMIGNSINCLAPPEYNDEHPYLLAVMQYSERVAHHETQFLLKDSTCCDVSLTLSPIQMHDGTIRGVSVIARSITLRKQREAKLNATEQALQQSHAQLRRLVRRQQQMQEHISARMAREIHDELAQLLTGLQIDIAWIMQQNPLSPDIHERLHSMSAQVDRLLLVDDHAVVREGVKRILTGVPDIVVAGEAEHAREVYEALATDVFDLVLLDVSLPQHNGLEILKHLHTAHPDLPILIFSVHPERQYVVRALQEGATGYLLKSSAPRELVTAIRQIAQGKRYVSAELVNHLVHEVAGTESPLHATLTPREKQVMRRLVAGQALKEIAHELGLSIKTVSTHRRRLLDKLRLDNTPDLVRYAIRHELSE